MKPNLIVRVVAPVLAISAIPLIVGVVAARNVYSLQRRTSKALDMDVMGIKSGENLAIGIRDIRTQLNQFVHTADPQHLQMAADYHAGMQEWYQSAKGAAETGHEQTSVARLGDGYKRFFAKLDAIIRDRRPPREKIPDVHELVETTLKPLMLDPAQEFLDANEREIVASNARNREMAQQVVLGLLLLGICGPVSGIVAGFGIARRYNRSMVRLSLPIQDAAGKLNEIVGPITFSTGAGIEEIEIVLHKIAAQIGAVMQRLEDSQREALRAEQLATVGQMAAGIAHELRNPLMAMKILVQAAAESSPPALHGRDLAVLEEEITRLERSTGTFLDFARPPQLERRVFDLRAVIDQVLDLVNPRAERQGVSLRCEAPVDRSIPIQADRGQICQVLLNLLLNALDAVPTGGSICVELDVPEAEGDGPKPEFLTLRVRDNGPGLPAGWGPKVFEPFVGTKPSGLGLGLSICKHIVESHGGEIAAGNRPEGGAEFSVKLPIGSGAPYGSPRLAAGTA